MSGPSREQILRHLRRANEVARAALAEGRHPFGAVLVGPDHERVLFEQGNLGPVEHAEAVLVRTAFRELGAAELAGCTLYTTVEPCAMCAGTAYWANVGRVVFGMAEADLRALTGAHPENPTLDLPCRELYARGQRQIEVLGPVPEVEEEIAGVHRGFWG